MSTRLVRLTVLLLAGVAFVPTAFSAAAANAGSAASDGPAAVTTRLARAAAAETSVPPTAVAPQGATPQVLPDLVAEAVYPSDNADPPREITNLQPGTRYYITLRWRVDNAPAYKVRVDLGLDRAWVSFGTTAVADPAYFYFTRTTTSYVYDGSSHTLRGWVDRFNAIAESNETNNLAIWGTGGAVIEVVPDHLDFGEVEVGANHDLAFRVRNIGTGTLIGAAGTTAPFSIAGGGSYSLPAGTSQTVTVRFSPPAATSYTRTVSFTGGGGATRFVTGEGIEAEIEVTPDRRDFGDIELASSRTLTFTVRNIGRAPLVGTAATTAPFAIVSGGSYTLPPGTSQTVAVRFSPVTAGDYNELVNFTGGGGAARPVTGRGVPPPRIEVVPASLDFGDVEVGLFADLSFVVRNIGGGTLNGSASAPAPFSIVAGANYNLPAGSSQTVTVRFAPSASQFYDEMAAFTGGGGAARPVRGRGTPPPQLEVTPPSLDFGDVQVGSSLTLPFSVRNIGGGTLVGAASTSAPFGIVAGANYNLPSGSSQTVAVRFAPQARRSYNGLVAFTGGGGAGRPVRGRGVQPEIACDPASFLKWVCLDGGVQTDSLLVWNAGESTLNYTLDTTPSWVSVLPAAGSSTASPNQHTVSFNLAGLSVGSHSGSIRISDPAAANNPVVVPVTLNVTTGVIVSVGVGSGYPGSAGSTVPLGLQNAMKVKSLWVELTDKPDWLRITSVSVTQRTSPFTPSWVDDGSATPSITLSSPGGGLITTGTGPVCTVYFSVAAGARLTSAVATAVVPATALVLGEHDETLRVFAEDDVFWIGHKGDLDPDGPGALLPDRAIDLFDVLTLIDLVQGVGPPLTPYNHWAGDLNDDGIIDIFDILILIDIVNS